MKPIRWFLLVILLCSLSTSLYAQETTPNAISYGMTRSAFYLPGTQSQQWAFEAEQDDIIQIHAVRIAGQMMPQIRLLDVDGDEISSIDAENRPYDTALHLWEGLPQAGTYTVEVSNSAEPSTVPENPDEYAITLSNLGQRRTPEQLGLDALPTLGTEPLPVFETGELADSTLGINLYGNPDITEPASGQPNVYILQRGPLTATLDNSFPLASGIRSVTMQQQGIGIIADNNNLAQDQAVFYTNQTVRAAYVNATFTYTFTLESGQTITTDFFNISRIDAVDGLVAVTFSRTDAEGNITEQHAVFDNEIIDLRRPQQGPNEKPLNGFLFGDEGYLYSDLIGWHTLAYLDGNLTVYYGSTEQYPISDGRFITSDVRVDRLLVDAGLTSIQFANNEPDATHLLLDWERMGDAAIEGSQLHLRTLDGRDISHPLASIDSVQVIQGGIQTTLRDGTIESSLPDGTLIETPPDVSVNNDALPLEANFRANGYNNLGEHFLRNCPCMDGQSLYDGPVNPANGNFYMAITDFSLPSHTLGLEFTRYFNSQSRSLTPDYLSDAPTGTLGQGWRHSYQYDLDLTFASRGRITLILPEGAQHHFVLGDDGRYRSRSLPQWIFEQQDSILGPWVGYRSDGTRFDFDRAGRLQTITDYLGNTLYLVTAPTDYLVSNGSGTFVVEPYGRRLELYTDPTGKITSMVDPLLRSTGYTYAGNRLTSVAQAGYQATYEYDRDGLLTRYNDAHAPDADQVALGYDARSRITSLLIAPDSEQSHLVEYAYEDDGTATRSQTVNGALHVDRWRYTRDAIDGWLLTRRSVGHDDHVYEYAYQDGRLVEIRLPNLTRYSFQYDARGSLTRFKDPFAIYEPYDLAYTTINERTLPITIDYPNNGRDSFEYDEQGRLTARIQRIRQDPQLVTATTRYAYDASGRLAAIIAPDNSATIYRYDAFGYVSAIWRGVDWQDDDRYDSITADRAQQIMTFQHDLLGQLRSINDGTGRTWLLNWQMGQLSNVTLPDGGIISYSYDDIGRMIAYNDRGAVTSYTYDDLGHLISTSDPLGNITQTTYDALGNLLQLVNALDETTQYNYDVLGNLTSIVTPDGLTTQYQVVDEAPPSSRSQHIVTEPGGRQTTWRYDATGRLVQVSILDGTFSQVYSIDYNAIGLPTRIQKENGRTLSLAYNLLGDITSTRLDDIETRYAYDMNGRLNQVTEPNGRSFSYGYDLLGNVVSVTEDDGDVIQYAYDTLGRVIAYTDAIGRVTQYTYDADGHLQDEIDAEGNRTSYGYDDRGNLASMQDALGNITNFAYDLTGNQVTEIDGLGHEIDQTYDALSRLIAVDYNAEGRDLFISYDISGQISSISAYRDRVRELYSYDTAGRLTTLTNPLGYTTSFRYNGLGQLSSMIDAIGNEQEFTWLSGRYALGRYTDEANRTYSYENIDSVGRLLSLLDVTTPEAEALNRRYSYDVMGDITQAQTFNINSNNEQVITDRYTYDTDGRVTQYINATGSQWQLTYDASGQLVEAVQPDGIRNVYAYDLWGNIIQATYATGTPDEHKEHFVYDAVGNLLEYTSTGGIVTRYQYDANQRLTSVTEAVGTEQERTYGFAYNELGQVVRYTDPMGMPTEYRYSRDNLVQVRQPLGDEEIATFYEYDLSNNLTTVRLPEILGDTANTINLAYNALNQRVRFTDTLSNVWAYNYDTSGNLIQVSDPLGSITRYAYDTNDRLIRTTLPTNATITYDYNIVGNLSEIELPRNAAGDAQSVDYSFDRMGRLLTATAAEGRTSRYQYDVMGQLISIQQPDGTTTELAYDAHGQLVQYGDTQVEYDTDGHVVGLGNGQSTIGYAYDALGRVVAVTEQTGGDTTLSLAYTYDANDQLLIRQSDEFGTVQYQYDELGRLISLGDESHSVTLVYDTQGHITQLGRSNGITTFYAYDGNGRVVLVQHFDANNERLERFDYRYDAIGNLVRVDRTSAQSEDSASRITSVLYTYDIAHRLISERWLDGNGTAVYTLELRYDDAGNRIETIRNGQRTQYVYNSRNQLIETHPISGIATINGLPFAAIGLLTLLLLRRRRSLMLISVGSLMLFAAAAWAQGPYLPAGLPVDSTDYSYAYDSNGRISEIASAAENIAFSYNDLGLLAGIEQATADGASGYAVALAYDALARLSQWQNNLLIYDDDTLLAQADTIYMSMPDGERLLSILPDADMRWHLNDGLSSTRRFVDDVGDLLTPPETIRDFGSFGEWLGTAPADDMLVTGYQGIIYEPFQNIYLQDGVGYVAPLAMNLQPPLPWQEPAVINNENPSRAYSDPALALGTLPQVVEPEMWLHQPQLPNIPLQPDTRALQEAEMVRPLYLLAMTSYGSNQTTALLAPSMETFYIGVSNPAPERVMERQAAGIQQILALYESGNSWRTDLRPQPQTHDDPLAILGMVEPLIQQPLRDPLIWCWNRNLAPLLPIVPSIDAQFANYALEANIAETMVPIQPQFAFLPFEAPVVDPVAWLESQGSSQPGLDVLPTVTTQLEQAAADISGIAP